MPTSRIFTAVLAAALLAPATAVAATGQITTVAGTGTAGYENPFGQAKNAQLDTPTSVFATVAGDLLIADTGNRRVRTVRPFGDIGPVAGNGQTGNAGDGGDPSGAQLSERFAVAGRADGTYLIADTANGRVRAITGVEERTPRINGVPESGDRPSAIAVRPDGSFQFVDGTRVRQVAVDGTVTTVAGGGTGGENVKATNARLDAPTGVAVMFDGGFVIADRARVRRVSAGGRIATVAGTGTAGFSGDGGPAVQAQLGVVAAIAAAPDGSFVIADGNRIRRVAPDGVISTIAGTGVAGYNGDGIAGTAAQVNQPQGVAIDAEGDVVVGDTGNHRVRVIDVGDPPTPPGPVTTLTQQGFQPELAVDREGTTHVVYDVSRSSGPGTGPTDEDDQVGYCRIARGASACTDVKVFAGCPKRDDTTRSGSDSPHVMLSPFGDVMLLTHGRCPKNPPDPYNTPDKWVLYRSGDDGKTFGDRQVLGDSARPPHPPSHPDYRNLEDTNSTSLYDAAGQQIVIAESGGFGGLTVKGRPLDGGPIDAAAKLSTNAGGRPSLVQRAKGSFAVAYEEPDTVWFRTYNCPDCGPAGVSNEANWSAPQSLGFGHSPRLVSGPAGTYLIYQPNTSDRRWYIRQIVGSTLGPPRILATRLGVDYFVDAVQDPATGRLHFMSIDYRSPQFQADELKYRTATQPWGGWSAAGTVGEYTYRLGNPRFAVATGDEGFAGMVTWNETLPAGQRNPPILVRRLPVPPPEPPAFTVPGDDEEPEPSDPGTPPGDGGGATTPPPTGGGGGSTPAPQPGAAAPPPAAEGPSTCQVLQFGAADIVAEGCMRREGTAFIARGTVKMNGLKLVQPSKTAEIRFDPAKRLIKSTGPVSVALGDITLFKAPIDWELPKGNTVELPSVDIGKVGGKLFGFGLTGSVKPKLVRGAIEVPIHLGLPKLFGGVTGDTTLKADNLAGVHIRDIRVKVGNAPLGPLQVKDLMFNYDAAADKWDGGATLILIPTPPGPALTAGIGFKQGSLDYLKSELTLPGNGIPLEPFNVVYLKKIRFSLETGPPLKLSGGVTLTAGPTIAGQQAISVDGDLKFTFPDAPAPAILRADGVVKIVSIPVARSYLEFRTNGYIAYGGFVDYKYHDFGVTSGIEGWLYKKSFNVEASARICAGDLGCGGATIVISSEGVAGCIGSGFFSVGAGWKWGEFPDFMLTSCDVGPYRAVMSQAGGARAFTMGSGLRGAVVGVRGSTAPPHVTLVGPKGERIDAPVSGPTRTAKAITFHAPEAMTTYFELKAPSAGRWSVEVAPDSVPVVEVKHADALDKPVVKARVRGGKLTYTIKPIPGQKVRFAEEGKGVAQELGTARGTKGTLRFKPADGAGGRRKLVAFVSSYGTPRTKLVVGSYIAPPMERPGKPVVKVKRRTVTWKAVRGAANYRVRATLTDGRVLLLMQKTRRVTVTASGAITIEALRGDGMASKAVKVRVK